MQKINSFQIVDMTLSGFKAFSGQMRVAFGDPTVITGGNGRGKSSLADAIAFAITGLPFFGERKLDQLHSDDNPELHIRMRFVDENGAIHELARSRSKSRMEITYDGCEIRQRDLWDMFGERDVFLSILNPLYFIEELGDDGKRLLERYLPLIPQETVMEQLSEDTRRALQDLDLVSPEGRVKKLREDIRDMENAVTYLQGQQDMAELQRQDLEKEVARLTARVELLRGEQTALEEKQFAGMDVAAMQEELADLSARYSELLSDLCGGAQRADDRRLELNRRLGERKAAVYELKYAGPIAEATAKVRELALQYKKEARQYAAITPGFQCPTCRRVVAESDVPAVQAAFRASAEKILAQGRETKAQLEELQELERKARDTFERFKAEDVARLEAEIEQVQKAEDSSDGKALSQQGEQIHARIQQLTSELEFGMLSQEDYDRLKECRSSAKEISAELAAQKALKLPSADAVKEQILSLQEQIKANQAQLQHLAFYISKRAELTFSKLRINRVAISLYDVVKSTGEVKDTFRFTYGGRRYDRLSLSEKIRAGMEVSELFKRLTGRVYPTFVDNMESVDDLNNIRPTGQLIMAKCIANTELNVRPVAPVAAAETQQAA